VNTHFDSVPISIIGHPWAPIGMGEQMRSDLQACAALRLLSKRMGSSTRQIR
jgi:hypothetical protein